MDQIIIHGGKPLHGEITISGAKNAALPLMAASLLTDEPLILSNVPHLMDISTMATLLGQHGTVVEVKGSNPNEGHIGRVISLQSNAIHHLKADYEIVRKMRASVLVLAPLLLRFGSAQVSLPGGCSIGSRPINMHLEVLKAMGANISLEDGYIHASAPKPLIGTDVHFDKVSVGATETALMAATLAKGTTRINGAACEPEIVDFANCLNKMGAKIIGHGTSHISVEGVPYLGGVEHRIMPDRIEAGTYMAIAVATAGDLLLKSAPVEAMGATLDVFKQIGAICDIQGENLHVRMAESPLHAVSVDTAPYPGFATDMQAQVMAVLSMAKGISIMNETIFENRFMHVPELNRMGANIAINGAVATITGCKVLKGAPVMATDLRASVSLVIAGLAAKGKTVINRVYHIDRGYERIEEKLSACGARIHRVHQC